MLPRRKRYLQSSPKRTKPFREYSMTLLSVASPAVQTAAEIRQAGGEAIVVPGDVTAPDFPDRIVRATVDKFGGIDIIVNNAGTHSPPPQLKLLSKQALRTVNTKQRCCRLHLGWGDPQDH